MKAEVDEKTATFNSFREEPCVIKQIRISLCFFQYKLQWIFLDVKVCDAALQDTPPPNSCSAVIHSVSLQEC